MEEQSKRGIFPTACLLFLRAFVLSLFVFYATKLFKANSGRKESFRVFQREILGQSHSNVTDVETVRSNPKPEGILPLTEINSGSEPCLECDRKDGWTSIIYTQYKTV